MPIIMERLALAFKRSGMSYAEFEKATGISKATLQRYVTGKTEKIPMDALEKMAIALDVRASYLMGWEDNPTRVPPSSSAEGARIREISESLQHNPKLGLLFDRSRKMSERDLDAVLGIVEAILKERDDE